MARPLGHEPRPVPTDTAEDDLARLLATLHERGALRVLNALFGQLPGVAEVALSQLDTPTGRNLLLNVVALGKGLGEIDAAALQRFVEGAEKGLAAAGDSLRDEPPGLLGLTGRLSDRDVRRGLHAVLTLLATLGRHLHDTAPTRDPDAGASGARGRRG